MVAALWSSMRLFWPQWLVKLWLRGSAGRQRWRSWQLHCSAENFYICSWCCLWCDLAFLSSSIWMIKSFPSGADWIGSSACWEMNIGEQTLVGRLRWRVSRFKIQVFIYHSCLDQQSRPIGNVVQGSPSQQLSNNTIIRRNKYKIWNKTLYKILLFTCTWSSLLIELVLFIKPGEKSIKLLTCGALYPYHEQIKTPNGQINYPRV